MKRVEGKTALITGAARGQGRSHAIRLAEEGADIIALDLCGPLSTVPYELSSPADLQETVRLVEATGRRIYGAQADVRDFDELQHAIEQGVAELGGLDIVVANAGIMSFGAAEKLTSEYWSQMIDVNLTGVWHTAKAAIPHIRAGGNGGSMVLTSSAMGVRPAQNLIHYTAAKHGVIGVMRNLALELANERIRVNVVMPTCVDTDMIHNDACYELFGPDLPKAERSRDSLSGRFASLNTMEIPWIEPLDVSNAVLWLASDEARYVTGVALPIDGGQTAR
ncbi:mycofactocin-coupled SDR family oxidoreductase [Rhodococcus enclensis]|nr:mycofactocin-coupled SDR family oxidoreductase [Rhodococcus qingshengii]